MDEGHETDHMTAVVRRAYGGPEVLSVERTPRPTPGPGEVLVRVHAAGVTLAMWHLLAGLPRLIRFVGYGVRRPKDARVGLDLAGVVEAVGERVTGLAVGDEVYGTGTGTWAEHAIAEPGHLAPKPAGLTFEQAATVPYGACTALLALRDQARVESGQHVLVIGASGAVGTFAVQLAKAMGAEVTGVCSTPNLDFVTSLGADHVVDYTQHEITDAGVRYDAILDIAGDRSLSLLRRALTPKGTAVIVGGEGGGPWLGSTTRLMRAPFVSAFVSQRFRMFVSKEETPDLVLLNERFEQGSVTPAVDRTYPLAQAADAVRHLESGHPRGVIVLTT